MRNTTKPKCIEYNPVNDPKRMHGYRNVRWIENVSRGLRLVGFADEIARSEGSRRTIEHTVDIIESCGQITETLKEYFPECVPFLKYHLNDMKASCEHQEAEGWDTRPIDPAKPLNTYGKHYAGQQHASWNMLVWVRPDEFEGGLLGVPCPTCGYKYGTAWLKRELPPEVRTWAETFGEAERAGVTDGRIDLKHKHANESDAGDLRNPDLYHLAVRVTRTGK